MAWKLIYTSAPRLLQAGRSGFGTVARHREIPPLVAETAEKSSQFSRQTGLDSSRVIFAYRLARSSAGAFHLLTRISDAGTDYSGRTNHLAEHLILSGQEALRLGAEGYTPAGVMLAYEWTGYEGQARWLGDEDLWQPSATDANTGGSHWQAATTDANRVKLLASAEAQSGAVLEYPAHYQSEAHPWILWLFAESQFLCPQSGWGITFTTNVQPTDSLSDFRWLGAPDNSPVLQKLQGSGRPIFNFSTEAPKTFVHTPDAQESAPISVPEGLVRSAASTTRGPDVVKAGPPPKKPRAVERRTRSYKFLYTLLSVLIVALMTGIWWFLPADAPAPPAPPKPSDFSTQANTEEPSVASISPQKAVESAAKKSTEEETVAVESKLIDANKTTEPAVAAPASSYSEQKPTTPVPPRVRPSRTLVLFPSDSWEQLNWPDSWSFEDLQITVIGQSGKKQILKAPTKVQILTTGEKFYHTESGDKVFRASGRDNGYLPNERLKKDAHVFHVSSTKTPDEVWRVYVLPDDESLQSVVPADDPLMLGSFVILAGGESNSLQLDTTDLVFAEFLSYVRDQACKDADLPTLVLEASYPEPESIQQARAHQMIDDSTAARLSPLRIPIDNKGRLVLEEAKKPFSDLGKQMEDLRSSASGKPSDTLSETRRALLTSLQNIAKAMDSTKGSDGTRSIFPDGKLAEIPQNMKSEDIQKQLEKLVDQYFDRLDSLLPKGDNNKLQDHRKLALEHILKKEYRDAGKRAELFIEEKRQESRQDSLAIKSEEKALADALDLFVQSSSNAITDNQRELAGKIIEELPQSLPHLFYVPPQVPDLSYTLKIRRGSAAGKPELIITENIPVKRAEGPKVTPTP